MPALPDAENAFIEEAKLTSYLLNLAHREGGPKAAFFIAFGFSPGAPDILAEALLEQARNNEAREVAAAWGTRYIVDAPIRTPAGRTPRVRSIWEIKDGPPRLVTAYPSEWKP